MPGNYSHTFRSTGTNVDETVYNGDHQNHINNHTPGGLDDYSVNVAQMQTTTDPGEVGTESLATSTAGELERLRHQIKEIKEAMGGLAIAQWYTSVGLLRLHGNKQCLYRNLSIDRASAVTVTVLADWVLLLDASNNAKLFPTLSETPAITASGANGLDTGIEADSTWYHIWAIGKTDGTLDTLFSLSATAPTLPSGYTYKGYLGAIFNDIFSSFIVINQRGPFVSRAENLVISGGSGTTYTSMGLLTAIPTTAVKMTGHVQSSDTGTSAGWLVSPANDNTLHVGAVKGNLAVTGSGSTTVFTAAPFTIDIITSQTAYYRGVAATDLLDITITGWEF